MSNALIVEILLGLLTVTVGTISFVSASRANRTQAKAVVVAVDAEAYTRAREIYEGALETLRAEVKSMREEITRLRRSNDALRDEISDLRDEITRLRS